MITSQTIQQITSRIDIIDVVGEFVKLKKRGTNYIGNCPFHNEKSPSFTVSPAKEIYKCFGCGKAGDSVRFVMDMEGLGYGEALRHLAKKYGIQRYLQVSTDEVYGAIPTGSWEEDEPLQPNSPYSASKAGADLLVLAYGKTHGMNIGITRCCNNYGMRQFPEK